MARTNRTNSTNRTSRTSTTDAENTTKSTRTTPVTQIQVRRIDQIPTIPPARPQEDGTAEALLDGIRHDGDRLGEHLDAFGRAIEGELAILAVRVRRTVRKVDATLMTLATQAASACEQVGLA